MKTAVGGSKAPEPQGHGEQVRWVLTVRRHTRGLLRCTEASSIPLSGQAAKRGKPDSFSGAVQGVRPWSRPSASEGKGAVRLLTYPVALAAMIHRDHLDAVEGQSHRQRGEVKALLFNTRTQRREKSMVDFGIVTILTHHSGQTQPLCHEVQSKGQFCPLQHQQFRFSL